MALGLFDSEATPRRCAQPGCGIVLSRYNEAEFCWTHQPRRLYLVHDEPEFDQTLYGLRTNRRVSAKTRRTLKQLCSVEECTETSHAHTLCYDHYNRWYRRNRDPSKRPQCSVEGCSGVMHARDLCMNHYKQWEWRSKIAAGYIRRKGRWVQDG